MQYEIIINYTANEEKAGKLSVVDNTGKTVLDNVAVAVPITSATLSNNNNKLRHIKIEFDSTLENFDAIERGSYRRSVDILRSKGRNNLIVNAFNNVVFAGNLTNESFSQSTPVEAKKLQSDKNSFILHPKDFKILSNLISGNNSFTVKTNKVSFLWFPEKLHLHKTDINAEYNNLDTIKRSLEVKRKQEQEKLSQFTAKAEKINHTQNKIKATQPQAPVSKKVTHNNSAQNVYNNRRQDDYYNDSNDLDPFDVVFMYNNPELAPMYKPNSMLAWYMYFSENEVSRSTITEDVKNIPGFENVENADLKYTASGYSIELYEDEQKSRPLGTLNYNNEDKSYNLESPRGQSTNLKVEDNGIINGSVTSINNSETNFSFAQKNDGFVGNWHSTSSQGVQIGSGMVLNSDYDINSNLEKSIDLQEVVRTENLNNSYNFEPEPEVSNNYEKDWTPPPPPPPPPPKDTEDWSSTNDLYSNSSSFKM